MRKLLLFVGGFFALLIAAALLGPSFIDWNSHKAMIAAKAREATGRTLSISGNLSLSILPLPTLSADGVRLSNMPGGATPDMLAIEKLKVRVALAPLLGGKVEVENISLVNPVIMLETLKDGRSNWQFEPEGTKEAPSSPGGKAAGQSGSTPSAGPAFRFDQVRIENGSLVWHDGRNNSIERVERITANLAAESLSGPFRATGSLVAREIPLGFDVGVGALSGEKATPVNIALTLGGDQAKLKLNGLLSNLSQGQTLRGKLSLDGRNLAQTAALAGAPIPPALAGPFALETQLSASAAAIGMQDATLSLGESQIKGEVNVALLPAMRIEARLNSAKLDLDKFIAASPAAPSVATGPSTPQASPTPAKPQAKSAESDFSLPKEVQASFELGVETAIYNAQAIRQTVIRGALANGELTISQASAQLPGPTDFAFFGMLVSTKGRPHLDATLETKSDNLRSTLDWLKISTAELPGDRLRKVSLTAHLAGGPADMKLNNLDLRFDASRLTGAAVARLEGRPAFGVTATLDKLNLDAYLPLTKAAQPQEKPAAKPDGKLPAAQPGQKPEVKAAPPSFLNDFDMNLRAQVGQLVWHGNSLQNGLLDAALLKGEISIKDLSVGDFAGASLKASGGISGLPTGAMRLKEFTYDLRTKTPSRLAGALGFGLPLSAEKLGAVAARGKLSGDLNQMAIDTQTEAAGTILKAVGSLAGLDKTPKIDLGLEASHGNLAQMVRLFAEDWRPANPNLGPFAFASRLKGDANNIEFGDLRSRLGPVNLAGKAALALSGPRPKLTASLTSNEVTVDAFLPAKRAAENEARPNVIPVAYRPGAEAPGNPVLKKTAVSQRWSREPLDLSALKGFDAEIDLAAAAVIHENWRVDKPNLQLLLANGVATLPKFVGQMFGGAFNITGKLDATAVPAANFTLNVDKANVRQALFNVANVNIADGTLNFSTNLSTSGKSVADMVSRLAGEAKLDTRDGLVQGFDLKAMSQKLKNIDNVINLLALFQSGMSGGSTRFSSLTGNFKVESGIVRSNDIKLIAESGEGQAVATADLPQWQLDSVAKFRLTDFKDAPAFSMKLQGELDNPRRIFDFNEFQAWLASRGLGKLLKDGKIGGKAGNVLEKVLPGAQTQTPTTTAPQGTTTPQTTTPQQQQKPKVEDAIKGIFKGLGR
jgi:uncharacterized protein involved in outer membrane biogenesis